MSPIQILLSFLMLAAGVGIPIMAAMNAGLGTRMQSPISAVFVLCSVAFCIAALLLIFSAKPSWNMMATTPPIFYFGGAFFVFYIASVTISAPIIGLGNAVFYVLLGQILCAAVIDHYGFFGVSISAITPRRVLGLLIMAIGVYLARKDLIQTVMSPT